MKILMLADAGEPHIIRWVNALCKKGIEVILFSFKPGDPSYYESSGRITFYDCGFSHRLVTGRDGSIAKLSYLKVLPRLRKVISIHQPDLLHAHYAAGYGLMGALSRFRPFMVSAWGSDVLSFPGISPLHRRMIRWVLHRADRVLSTSHYMARHISQMWGIQPEVTPFGIDTGIFRNHHTRPDNAEIILGSVKNLKPEYSLQNVLMTFGKLREMMPDQPLRLILVGDGPERGRLEQMSRDMQISQQVTFFGYQPYNAIARYHNMLDIYINLPRVESFGVSVLEASACERPVVTHHTGGLPEVVRDGMTGYLVEKDHIDQAARAVRKLIRDKDLRTRMGKNGRQWVRDHYSLETSVSTMTRIYGQLTEGK